MGIGFCGLGFGVWGLGFGVWGLGFEVWSLRSGVWDLGSKVGFGVGSLLFDLGGTGHGRVRPWWARAGKCGGAFLAGGVRVSRFVQLNHTESVYKLVLRKSIPAQIR